MLPKELSAVSIQRATRQPNILRKIPFRHSLLFSSVRVSILRVSHVTSPIHYRHCQLSTAVNCLGHRGFYRHNSRILLVQSPAVTEIPMTRIEHRLLNSLQQLSLLFSCHLIRIVFFCSFHRKTWCTLRDLFLALLCSSRCF
jgi:hypothetical protein